MAERKLPSFDLVVATVDRVQEPGRLLDSLDRQPGVPFRVLLVDQNDDDRLAALVGQQRSFELIRLRSGRGLSHARNTALPHIAGELVAFPDDDCLFPDELLTKVARRFAAEPALDGITGRAANSGGESSPSWSSESALLTRTNLWNRAISFTIFLRSAVLSKVGEFDEQLGLGSGTTWSSGEELDYLVRALDAGARIEYDRDLIVVHEDKAASASALRSLGARDGASMGYLLRKHRYPARIVTRMLLRPAGGILLALTRGDRARALFHLETLLGRLRGLRAA